MSNILSYTIVFIIDLVFKGVLLLTLSGAVYFVYYTSETQCPQQIETLKDKEIAMIATHVEGKHYMALENDGTVYSWGNGDAGRLGK